MSITCHTMPRVASSPWQGKGKRIL